MLTGIATVLTLLVTANGAPALYTALAGEMAQASGLARRSTVVSLQVIGYSTLFFPYQAPPDRVRQRTRRRLAPGRDAADLRFGLVSLLVAAPLDYAWWRLLGQLQ